MRITLKAVHELNDHVLALAWKRAEEEGRETIRAEDIEKVKKASPS